jgi:hypothetical protein
MYLFINSFIANVSKRHHQRATDTSNYYEPTIYTDDEEKIGHLETGRNHSFAYQSLYTF